MTGIQDGFPALSGSGILSGGLRQILTTCGHQATDVGDGFSFAHVRRGSVDGTDAQLAWAPRHPHPLGVRSRAPTGEGRGITANLSNICECECECECRCIFVCACACRCRCVCPTIVCRACRNKTTKEELRFDLSRADGYMPKREKGGAQEDPHI
jgi:hypothetical protein